jgi:signal transduction histidine kinase
MMKSYRTRFPQGFPAASARQAADTAPVPRTRWQWLADVAVSVVVIGVSLAGSLAATSWHPNHPAMNLVGYLLVIMGGASLIVRRRYPVVVLGVTLVTAQLAGPLGNAYLNWLPLIVAFFAAVRARRRAAAITSLVIGFLVSVWPPWLIGSRGHTKVTYALALLCGLLVLLITAELMRAAAQRRLAAGRIREEELLRRASEERMRIARDLHDVVAHNISVINVQANTALHLADRQPDRAREALATINDVSKQALAELRSVLGILRADGESAPRTPTPGLGRLGTLVANMAAAGLKVELETEGTPAPLPASADLAAYRIIQEALTNSARHSGGTRATVRVRYRDDEVEIEVTDDGTSAPSPSRTAGTGSGIAGMTDRARALGGSLTAGPRPGGGFRVTALLPVGGER